jgi:hypothetical protein
MGDITELLSIKNKLDSYIKYIDDPTTFNKYIPSGDPNLSFTDQFIEKYKDIDDINEIINNVSISYCLQNRSSFISSRRTSTPSAISVVSSSAVTPPRHQVLSPPPPPPQIQSESINLSAICIINDPLDRSYEFIKQIIRDEEEIIKNEEQVIDDEEQIKKNNEEFSRAIAINLEEELQLGEIQPEKDFEEEEINEPLIIDAIIAAGKSTTEGGIRTRANNFYGPRPFRQRGGAKTAQQVAAVNKLRNRVQENLSARNVKATRIKKDSKLLGKIGDNLKKKKLEIIARYTDAQLRTIKRNNLDRENIILNSNIAAFDYIAGYLESYHSANLKQDQNETLLRVEREGKKRPDYDQGKWDNQCRWIYGDEINETDRCYLCQLPLGKSVQGKENRNKLTEFYNYQELKTISKYSKESGEHIYTSIIGFGLLGYPNNRSQVNDETKNFYKRGLDWAHFWCNLVKNELLFVSLNRTTGILRVREDNIQWMIKALVWGTGEDRYIDSEKIKTILCKDDRKFLYPTYILAFIDGIYKRPDELFIQAANRFILTRTANLRDRVTKTVNFLNRILQPNSMMINYQTRIRDPAGFINVLWPTSNQLQVNNMAVYLPLPYEVLPPSPPCNPAAVAASAPLAVAASAPLAANQYGLRLAGGRFAGTYNYRNRKTRAKKYKSRKTRKLRK